MSDRVVLFAGGGTAGHVFPALAVARALTELAPDIEPVFVGTENRLEGRLVPEAGFRLHHVPVLPLPRRPSWKLFKVPFALNRSIRSCVDLATEERAVAAATFGGYVSFPLAWASARTHLPLVVHEQNSIPGLANRFATRWADRIAVTFPGSADRFKHSERVAVTGNPVRDEILSLDPGSQQRTAREHFGLDPDRTTMLVFGGSQGSRTINRATVDSYPLWQRPGELQILHGAGENLHRETATWWEQAKQQHDGPAVRCVDFIDDMGLAYAAADVIVCRAGATSIAELTVLGRPALLVPYPHATHDHQLHNASAVAAAGGAAVAEDDELDGERLVAAVEPWLLDSDLRAEVAEASRSFGRRDAAQNVARLVLDLI